MSGQPAAWIGADGHGRNAADASGSDRGDRFLPMGPIAFGVLVVTVAAGVWGIGYLLAADKVQFLGSPEWQVQPFYLATHLVALRLIVAIFARNFRIGIAHLDGARGVALGAMRRLLGPLGVLAALVLAAPFIALDYRHFVSPRYVKLGQGDTLQAVDYAMFAIWCLEWVLNALISTTLIGFLAVNQRTLRQHAFASPIEVVLHEKHYRPFLRMSSQAATVVLAFSAVTVFYIWHSGGELSDYLGLTIMLVLLAIGFIVPFTTIKSKVRQEVRRERKALQVALVRGAWREQVGQSGAEPAADIKAVQARLDYVVAMQRLGHLDILHRNIGVREARAVTLRLLASVLAIGWQVSQNFATLIEKLGKFWEVIGARIGG